MDVDFLDPLGLAHRCSRHEDLEREVLTALDRTLGFDVAFMATLGDTPTTVGLDAHAPIHGLRSGTS